MTRITPMGEDVQRCARPATYSERSGARPEIPPGSSQAPPGAPADVERRRPGRGCPE